MEELDALNALDSVEPVLHTVGDASKYVPERLLRLLVGVRYIKLGVLSKSEYSASREREDFFDAVSLVSTHNQH